jgi:signal transduction histidine kinase
MSEEKRRESAGRVASAIALPEWSLRRKLALALAIPMLLAATFGGLRVQSELSQSDNYSATAKQITVLRPAAGYLAAAERAIIVSRQHPQLQDQGRLSAIAGVGVAAQRLETIAKNAELTPTQQDRLDSVLKLSEQLRTGDAYLSTGQAVSQVRQLQRGVTELIDSIVAAQIEPEPMLAALQQALDGRVSLAMQEYQVNIANPKSISLVDLSAEMGVEQVIIDRLGSYLGTTDPQVQKLNQQNAVHFGVIRGGGFDIGDAEQFEAYDALSGRLLDDIDKNLTSAANNARGLAIANAVITVALLLAAFLLALFVSRMLLNPIRRVREGALEVANERLPEMVAKIRAGEEPGEIITIPVTTHEEMGQLARAVDDLHRQAVSMASGEAKLRSQVGEMFSTLSRRNTSLINQQLGLIERLEKDEEDPNRLESLFRLDHLASRMRRTADSLMVLADAPTQTSDTDALALGDVFQASMAGVQEYQRVQIESASDDKLNGAAAADVVHLMTELIDNALAFSPPTAPVKISTKQAGDSTIVEISDGGLGIAQDVLNSLNEDLRSGGEVTVETARRMGLLVVSRLAKRHGITVSLARNTRGGTTATVLLPPALLRGRAAAAQPKQRPGLGSLASAKSVLPATATEQLSNETEPTKLPDRNDPLAPDTPAAAAATFARPAPAANPLTPAASSEPATPAARPVTPVVSVAPVVTAPAAGPEAPAAKASTPEVEVDPIAAAINAVTRLPRRDPGATRTGAEMPGAPVRSTGGSLFQRLRASEAAEASKPDLPSREPSLPQREPSLPTAAFGAIDESTVKADAEAKAARARLDLAPPSSEALRDDAEHHAVSMLEDVVTPLSSAPATPVDAPRRGGLSNFHALNAARNGIPIGTVNGTGAGPLDRDDSLEQEASGALDAAEPLSHDMREDVVQDVVVETPAASWLPSSHGASAAPPAAESVYDLLDSRSPMPEPTEDETPIFRTLRSRWLSSAGDATWTRSEIEAGWEAAEQVAEKPALKLSDSGLPVRRPGNRLVPGGVAPTPASVNRDPAAIRARLAAHAAGVSRGRTAAVDEAEHVPASGNPTEEGPA